MAPETGFLIASVTKKEVFSSKNPVYEVGCVSPSFVYGCLKLRVKQPQPPHVNSLWIFGDVSLVELFYLPQTTTDPQDRRRDLRWRGERCRIVDNRQDRRRDLR